MVAAAPSDRAVREAEVKRVLDRAEQGLLVRPDEVDQVMLDADLREIRFQFPSGPYRLYFAEPEDEPNLLLALHCHRKRVDLPENLLRDDQSAHMRLARDRLLNGRASHWGI